MVDTQDDQDTEGDQDAKGGQNSKGNQVVVGKTGGDQDTEGGQHMRMKSYWCSQLQSFTVGGEYQYSHIHMSDHNDDR